MMIPSHWHPLSTPPSISISNSSKKLICLNFTCSCICKKRALVSQSLNITKLSPITSSSHHTSSMKSRHPRSGESNADSLILSGCTKIWRVHILGSLFLRFLRKPQWDHFRRSTWNKGCECLRNFWTHWHTCLKFVLIQFYRYFWELMMSILVTPKKNLKKQQNKAMKHAQFIQFGEMNLSWGIMLFFKVKKSIPSTISKEFMRESTQGYWPSKII